MNHPVTALHQSKIINKNFITMVCYLFISCNQRYISDTIFHEVKNMEKQFHRICRTYKDNIDKKFYFLI